MYRVFVCSRAKWIDPDDAGLEFAVSRQRDDVVWKRVKRPKGCARNLLVEDRPRFQLETWAGGVTVVALPGEKCSQTDGSGWSGI